MGFQAVIAVATELRQEARSARALAATFRDEDIVQDLLAYAAALEAEMAHEQMRPASISH
jgi:hypothetical protein